VQQATRLRLRGGDDLRSSVPEARHPKGRRAIEIPIAVDVPNVCPARPLPENRPLLRDESNIARFVPAEFGSEGARARAGDLGVKFGQHERVLAARARGRRARMRRTREGNHACHPWGSIYVAEPILPSWQSNDAR
jgi:hypothetical protein